MLVYVLNKYGKPLMPCKVAKTFLTERRLTHFLPTAKAGGIRASF